MKSKAAMCDVCRFGGGPEVRFLRQCPSCLHTHEALVRRQCREMNEFIIVSSCTSGVSNTHWAVFLDLSELLLETAEVEFF